MGGENRDVRDRVASSDVGHVTIDRVRAGDLAGEVWGRSSIARVALVVAVISALAVSSWATFNASPVSSHHDASYGPYYHPTGGGGGGQGGGHDHDYGY